MKDAVKKSLISGGGALGALASSRTGVPGLSIMGSNLGAKLSKLIGSGDYEANDVEANSLFKGKVPVMPTEFGEDPHHIRIRHREYLGDIVAGEVDTFTLTKFAVNPGLCATFPYLWQLASLYEEYTFAGLAYEYVSLTSPYNANSAMGAVIFAAEYNPYADPYGSKLQMENSDFALSVRPDRNMIYGVECAYNANTQNSYFVRQGASNAPRTATDLCDFYVGVQTTLNPGNKIGELWCCYDVILKRPILGRSVIATTHLVSTQLWASDFSGNSSMNSTTKYNTIISGTTQLLPAVSGYAVSGLKMQVDVTNVCPGDVYNIQVIFRACSPIANISPFPVFSPMISDELADYVNCAPYTAVFEPPFTQPPLISELNGADVTPYFDQQNKGIYINCSAFVSVSQTLGTSTIGIPIIVGNTGMTPTTDQVWNADVIITRVISGVVYKHF